MGGDDYPFLGIYRTISYVMGLLAIIGGVLIFCQSASELSRLPFLSAVITFALPFVAGLSAIGTGEMLGLLMEMRGKIDYQASESMQPVMKSIRDLTQEVKTLQRQIDLVRDEVRAAKPPAAPPEQKPT